MGSVTSVYRLFTTSERAKLGTLVALIVVGGFLEVFGVGVLFPFVAVLQDPSRIAQMKYLGTLYHWLNVGSDQTFIVVMSIGLLALFCFKALFTIFLANYQVKFVNNIQTQLGRRLLAHYIRSPYEFFLSANTATLIGNLTTSVSQLSTGVIQSGLMLMAELVSFLGILAFLVWLSPVFSFIAFIFAAAMAFTFLSVIRTRVAHYAKENDVRWKAMIRKVNEALNAVKEIKVLGRGQYFLDTYSRGSQARPCRAPTVLSQCRGSLWRHPPSQCLLRSRYLHRHRSRGRRCLPLGSFCRRTVRIVPTSIAYTGLELHKLLQALSRSSFQARQRDGESRARSRAGRCVAAATESWACGSHLPTAAIRIFGAA